MKEKKKREREFMDNSVVIDCRESEVVRGGRGHRGDNW